MPKPNCVTLPPKVIPRSRVENRLSKRSPVTVLRPQGWPAAAGSPAGGAAGASSGGQRHIELVRQQIDRVRIPRASPTPTPGRGWLGLPRRLVVFVGLSARASPTAGSGVGSARSPGHSREGLAAGGSRESPTVYGESCPNPSIHDRDLRPDRGPRLTHHVAGPVLSGRRPRTPFAKPRSRIPLGPVPGHADPCSEQWHDTPKSAQ